MCFITKEKQMEDFKFGDIVKDLSNGARFVIYRIDEDGFTGDGAFGKYGFDGEHVPHNYSEYEVKRFNINKTNKTDIPLAIKMHHHYLGLDIENSLSIKDEYPKNKFDQLMLRNYKYTLGKM